MTTSGTIAFTQTAGDLVTNALRKLGVVAQTQNADASQYAIGQSNLNQMLHSWQIDGPQLWGRTDGVFTLIDGQQVYTLSPRPMDVHNIRFAINGAERRPLSEWFAEDWEPFPAKTRTGAPTCFFLDRQRGATLITLWAIPTGMGSDVWTCPYSYDRVFEDVTGEGQEVDVPQEALELVTLALASRLQEEYPAGDSKDAARYAAVTQRAGTLYAKFAGFDRRGAVQFRAGGGSQ